MHLNIKHNQIRIFKPLKRIYEDYKCYDQKLLLQILILREVNVHQTNLHFYRSSLHAMYCCVHITELSLTCKLDGLNHVGHKMFPRF